MPPDKAERLTGYHTGGISPFGQRRAVPVVFDSIVTHFDEVAINGGKRGLILLLSSQDACNVLQAQAQPLCAEG